MSLEGSNILDENRKRNYNATFLCKLIYDLYVLAVAH